MTTGVDPVIQYQAKRQLRSIPHRFRYFFFIGLFLFYLSNSDVQFNSFISVLRYDQRRDRLKITFKMSVRTVIIEILKSLPSFPVDLCRCYDATAGPRKDLIFLASCSPLPTRASSDESGAEFDRKRRVQITPPTSPRVRSSEDIDFDRAVYVA